MEASKLKMEVREKILKVIERDGSADRRPLVASLALETSFTNDTIDKIIENMIEAKQITDNLGVLNVLEKQEPQGAQE